MRFFTRQVVLLALLNTGFIACNDSQDAADQIAEQGALSEASPTPNPDEQEKLDKLKQILENQKNKDPVIETVEGTSGDVGNSAIAFYPSSTDFGNVAIGTTSASKIVTIYNSSDYPIFISSASLGDVVQFNIESNTCPSGSSPIESAESCIIAITYTPASNDTSRTSLSLSYGISEDENTRYTINSDIIGTPVSSLTFGGVDSISNVGGTSAKINWTHVVGASNYYVYQIDSGVPTLINTVAAPTDYYVTTGLSVSTTYTYRVRVVDSNGISDSNTIDQSFTTLANPPPSISSISPNAGALAGGVTITINGSGFVAGITATIGGSTCASPTHISSTQMTCVTPAKSAGSYDLVVTNTDTQIGTLANAFTFQPTPTVSGVSPSAGSWKGGDTVTVSGSGFVTGASVTINGQACTSVSVDSDTNITCDTPALASGATAEKPVDVVVTNSDSQTDTLTNGFTYKFTEMNLFAGAHYPAGCRDGNSSDARFKRQGQMLIDGSTMYFNEYDGYALRAVNMSDSSVTTLVGKNCIQGYVDGTQSASRLHGPYGIVKVGSYFYISEYAVHTIRRVDPADWSITQVAGTYNSYGTTNGAGLSSKFRNPRNLATDGSVIYIADQGNNQIRKYDPVGDTVSLVAGSSSGFNDAQGASAKFKTPTGLYYYYDGSEGWLFVSDNGNHRIRKIRLATGDVSTFAGSGSAGFQNGVGTSAKFNGPLDITGDGTYLYVAENYNIVRQIDISTGLVTTLAGTYNNNEHINDVGTDARFDVVRNITNDASNVYVRDDTYTIRKIIKSTGAVSTFSGTMVSPKYLGGVNGTGTDARFNLNAGVTYFNGKIYVAATSNNTIREIDPSTAVVSTFTGGMNSAGGVDAVGVSARHNGPRGIAGYGNYLYVSDYGKHTIRKIDKDTAEVTTFAGIYNSSGNTDDANGLNAQFNSPYGLAIDSTGTYMYVADYGNHLIRKINLSTSEVTTLAGSSSGSVDGIGTGAQFKNPQYLTIVGNYLYVTSSGDHKLRRVDLTTTQVESLNYGTAGYLDHSDIYQARFWGPRGITNDGSNIYIAEYNNHAIRRYNIATGAVSTVTANLQPGVFDTTSNIPMYEISGSLDTATINYPYDIVYVSGIGLVVSNDYGIHIIE